MAVSPTLLVRQPMRNLSVALGTPGGDLNDLKRQRELSASSARGSAAWQARELQVQSINLYMTHLTRNYYRMNSIRDDDDDDCRLHSWSSVSS